MKAWKLVILSGLSHNLNTQSICSTEIIREGIILKESPDRITNFHAFTYFDLPETCYDSKYKNNKLPSIKNIPDLEEIKYCVPLSKYQIPLNRYSYLLESFMSANLVDLAVGNPTITPRKLGLIASRHNLVSGNDWRERIMEESREAMFISNQASERVSAIPNDITFKSKLKKKKIKLDPVLTPKKVENCEIHSIFQSNFNKDLRDFCGYAYNEDQMKFFTYRTNPSIIVPITVPVIK